MSKDQEPKNSGAFTTKSALLTVSNDRFCGSREEPRFGKALKGADRVPRLNREPSSGEKNFMLRGVACQDFQTYISL